MWILFVILIGGYHKNEMTTTAQVEFKTRNQCIAAGNLISKNDKVNKVYCFQK